jgi:hypothetical protein
MTLAIYPDTNGLLRRCDVDLGQGSSLCPTRRGYTCRYRRILAFLLTWWAYSRSRLLKLKLNDTKNLRHDFRQMIVETLGHVDLGILCSDARIVGFPMEDID